MRLKTLTAAFALPLVGLQASPAPAQQTAATAPTSPPRFGAPLGLPRDGDKLYIPDEKFPEVPRPAGWEAYSDIDGVRAKQVAGEITAIARKSRDDGNQFWGRITGTVYDHMTQDWVEAQFRQIGLSDVRRQPLKMEPLWYPESWSVSASADGAALSLKSAFPILDTVGTTKAGLTAEAVWLGLGTDADFVGRDVRGKAVFLYSIATPGGRAHSANWNGAIKRAVNAGAGMVFVVMGFPGDAITEPQSGATSVPAFTVSSDEGDAVRAALGAGRKVSVHVTADIGKREGLTTGNVWGVLPGATDESILIMAHTDSFFEGALDNASGIAMMLELARHYARTPQSERKRTLVFLTTPAHHQSFVGIEWVRNNYDFSKTAFIMNCEHPSQTMMYLLDAGVMTANTVSARRWYINGSPALNDKITGTLRDYGVSLYAQPERRPGGELYFIFHKAPSFHVLDHVIYHSTIDTLDMVPASGITAVGRAYASIIDQVNGMNLAELRPAQVPAAAPALSEVSH
ncbi:MAG: hypothetical protein BGP16_04305 [Sphingobium sp. 66-54]|nr:MAG: hypothetical protein BGP16_04305 [Sphingobium sp. 66-54]